MTPGLRQVLPRAGGLDNPHHYNNERELAVPDLMIDGEAITVQVWPSINVGCAE
jgi:hypothetical protein